jgi:hypothetical protein
LHDVLGQARTTLEELGAVVLLERLDAAPRSRREPGSRVAAAADASTARADRPIA